MRLTSTSLLVLLALDAQAQNGNTPSASQVVVNGKTEVEASRDFVAGKIIIGRERIAASGVQNTGELLRRDPAISIGKNGSIGLLGMNGYTQILVDGMPYSSDPLALDLVHVERIEIIKTSTAATGPYGIAGTINIIRKGVQRQALTSFRAGASSTGGRLGADLAWSNNQLAATGPFAYNLSLSARRRPSRLDSRSLETLEAPGQAAPVFEGERSARGAFESLTAMAELSWTPRAGHKLTVSPDAGHFISTNDGQERRDWVDGRSVLLRSHSRQTMTGVGLPLRWTWQPAPDTTVSLKAQVNATRIDPHASTNEQAGGAPLRVRSSSAQADTRGQFLNLDVSTVVKEKHEIAAGAKLIRNRQKTTYLDLVDGRQDPSLAALGLASASRVTRRQVFVQDDWRIDRSLALNLGVAAEQNAFRLTEGSERNRQRTTLWSPSGHIAKKIGGDAKRQIRFSLARSFQAPMVDQMLLHPRINPFAPCPSAGLCGPNTIDTGDSSGNPQLRPERARSMNLSYTQGIGKGSEVRIEAYLRDIRDKIGSDLALEDLPWASAPRWVYRPANLGEATIRGIDVEGRLNGKDIAARWAAGELHGSVGWAHSELSDLPGPDNRLAGHSPWRAKLGGSYSLTGAPLKLGVESSYLPGDWTRSNLSERVHESHRFTLGASAAWQLDPKSKFTLNLDNLLHRTSTRITEYGNPAGRLRQVTGTSDEARFSLRFDTRL